MPGSPSTRSLGRAVRRLRAERELTQETLADLAGISVVYVSNIERGESNPTWNVLVALADALEVGITELAGAAEAERRAPRSPGR